ncbi:MAG: hypothetical protein AAF614_01870 [Chloroflexota bacterium]
MIGYVGQAVALGRQLSFLLSLDNLLDPRWRLTTAVLWAIVGLGMWMALRWKRPFTRIAIPILFLINLSVTYFVQQQANQPLPFSQLRYLCLVLILIFSVWALNNQRAKQYFSKGV